MFKIRRIFKIKNYQNKKISFLVALKIWKFALFIKRFLPFFLLFIDMASYWNTVHSRRR